MSQRAFLDRERVSIFTRLLVVGSLSASAMLAPAFGRADDGQFVRIGVNPYAAAQPTKYGRQLHTLEGWHGELYMGYGDWDENTGPIEVSVYQPKAGTFATKLTFATEAIQIYRAIGDRLYAPAIDPVGSGQSASVAIGQPNGLWWNNNNVLITHAFDIASLDGRDLWLAGSRDFEAIVFRSQDRGATWTTALAMRSQSVEPGDFARFYFVFALRGKLYVQGDDFFAGPHPRSKVFDGKAWEDGPDLSPRRGPTRPVHYAGNIVYLGRLGLAVFDGRSVRSTGLRVIDFKSCAAALYILSEGAVRRSSDLSTWTTVATAPPNTVSIGLLDDTLYAGTTQSELYRFTAPVPCKKRS